jgi:hypothetical protein
MNNIKKGEVGMDKYIFRGFNSYSRKWRLGDLVHKRHKQLIITEADNYDARIASLQMLEVEEKSIGQFTGLHDSKGFDIYEGDIIEDAKINHRFFVYYDNEEAKFKGMTPEGISTGERERYMYSFGINQEWLTKYPKVIIGNMFENPELLCIGVRCEAE